MASKVPILGPGQFQYGRLRVSTRVLMAGVAVVALGSWLLGAAYRVPADGERWARHHWQRIDGQPDAPQFINSHCPTPYWPQFWRALLGLPWPGTFVCEYHEVGHVGNEGCHYRLVATNLLPSEEALVGYNSLKTISTVAPPVPK